MNKKLILLICALFLVITAAVSAQETEVTPEAAEEEQSLHLSEQFPYPWVQDRFDQFVSVNYYRFSPDVLFFDQIDMQYFPHEMWSKEYWNLLGRWDDGSVYSQMIYTASPATKLLMHGTSLGDERGFLRDFYLYATLFVEDNYPDGSGSCYVYYSNSMMIGYKESTGLLIDPQSGIYHVTNSYGGSRHATYTQNTIKHTLEVIRELDPADYTITADDAADSAVGTAYYPDMNLDAQFLQDWKGLSDAFRMKASPTVKAYRIEVIRENGVSNIFINGVNVFNDNDAITYGRSSKSSIPDFVSWSYGPMLNEGGVTVTCSIGDLYIFGKTKIGG